MKHLVLPALALCALAAGCAGPAPTRITAGGATAITTMGVDLQDFKNAAGQLTQAILVSPALANFQSKNGRAPVLNLGVIANKSDINIDMAQIAGRINEDLLNSGLVEIVANDGGALSADGEDAFMNDVKVNNAAHSDFYLEGTINLLRAQTSDLREKTYTFQLRLNNTQRRTVFQKTVDIAKQGGRGSAVGW